MKKIVVFGASGHAKVVIDAIEKQKLFSIVGIIDKVTKKEFDYFCDYKILGEEGNIDELIKLYGIEGGVIAVGDNFIRLTIFEKIRKIASDFNFFSIIHPDTSIAKGVSIGMGSVILAGVRINTDATVGSFCILNTNSSLDHDSVMKDFSSIGPNVATGGNVAIGVGAFLGIGSTIKHGVSVGDHAIVGGGAMVLNNVSSFTLAYGSPVKAIRKRKLGEPYL